MVSNPIDFFTKNKNKFTLPVSKQSSYYKISYSLIIPTAGRAPFLKVNKNPLYWCLIAVLEGTKLPTEIIVIDNTPEKIKDYSFSTLESIKKIVLKKNLKIEIYYFKVNNLGAALARNLGIQKAKNEIIHLLDDDCIPHKEASLAGVKSLTYLKNRHPNLYKKIAVFCLPQNKRATLPHKILPIKSMSKIDFNNFNFTGTISSVFPKEFLNKSYHYIINHPILLENFQGGNVFVFKSKIELLGGFPEYKGAITYGEETGLALKIKNHHLKIVYYPFFNLQAVHLSYGNHNPPNQLTGENWQFEKGKLTLSDMVTQSTVNRVDTGARVESPIYFYTKIKNFAQIIKENTTVDVEKWFTFCYDNFVKQPSPSFMDGKTPIDDFNKRKTIWKLAQTDFIMNITRSKENIKNLLCQ